MASGIRGEVGAAHKQEQSAGTTRMIGLTASVAGALAGFVSRCPWPCWPPRSGARSEASRSVCGGALTGIAVAVGPLVGGVLVSGLSWRWIFSVNVPVGAAALVLTALKVVESRDQRARRTDWAGFVTFSAALAALVYGLIESGRTSFTDGTVLGCFVASAVLLVVFVVVELRIRHPMFDVSLFRLPTFLGGDIAAFAMSAGMFSMLLYLVLYLQDVLGFSALQTGVRLLVLSGGMLVASTVSGRLSVKVPVRALIAPGLALIAVGLLLMRGLTASSSWTHLIPAHVRGIGSLGELREVTLTREPPAWARRSGT